MLLIDEMYINFLFLKGWASPVAALYGIHSIPMNFLLDRTGRIVVKNLRGSDLKREVSTLLQ